jgi:hypothetical protein
MAQLTGRNAVFHPARTIGAILFLACGLGLPAQSHSRTDGSSARWARISCSAWCDTCRPTYACYQDCARHGSPRVRPGCGSLRKLPPG